MEVQVECANITYEEREKILHRAAIIAGMMVKEIREKGIKSTYEDSIDAQGKKNSEG